MQHKLWFNGMFLVFPKSAPTSSEAQRLALQLPFNIRPINFKVVKARFCLPIPDANLALFVNIQVSNTFQLGFRLQLIINEPFEIVPFDLNLEVVPVSYLNFPLNLSFVGFGSSPCCPFFPMMLKKGRNSRRRLRIDNVVFIFTYSPKNQARPFVGIYTYLASTV